MHRIFLSDLHLEGPDDARFIAFHNAMQVECRQVDEIYILGDLVEMWVGDDDDTPAAAQLCTILREAAQHCVVFLMHGNRDFLFGDDFARRADVTLLPDPYLTGDGVLLSHGDALCTDDTQYQQMRTVLRSPQWQQDILSKSLLERQQFGAALRAQSRQNNANKPANIMDVNPAATTALIEQHAAKVLIHGHTHRPGVYEHGNWRRLVTGAWERCGWLVRQQDRKFELECFNLAHRYGT